MRAISTDSLKLYNFTCTVCEEKIKCTYDQQKRKYCEKCSKHSWDANLRWREAIECESVSNAWSRYYQRKNDLNDFMQRFDFGEQ